MPKHPDLPDARDYGIRLSLADVRGISDAEVTRIVAGRPYHSLADFWNRARVSRPVAERIALAGGFDTVYGLSSGPGTEAGVGRRGRITRRDMLLHLAELDRWSRALESGARRAGRSTRGARATVSAVAVGGPTPTDADLRARAAAQSGAALPVVAAADHPVQLALDLGDRPELDAGTGLPELTGPERVRVELDVLGLDASAHVVAFYAPMLDALGVTRSEALLRARSRSTVLAGGVKVATQTPPIRSGQRVVFLTLDDSTGPVDATFFEDVQGHCAATVFDSWLLLVRGVVRRTGDRGVSLRATGAWELGGLWTAWRRGGLDAVLDEMERGEQEALEQAAAGERAAAEAIDRGRRVLVHASGFRQSPYADVRPPGTVRPPRKLWHASPGSPGR